MAPAARPVLPKINTHVPSTSSSIKPPPPKPSSYATKCADTSKDGSNQPEGNELLRPPGQQHVPNAERGPTRGRPDLPIPATPIVVPPTPASAASDTQEIRYRSRSPGQESVSEEEEDEHGEEQQDESIGYVEAESPSEYHDEDDHDREHESKPKDGQHGGADDVQIVLTPEEENHPQVQITESPTMEEPDQGYVEFESPVSEHDYGLVESPRDEGEDERSGTKGKEGSQRGSSADRRRDGADDDDDDSAEEDIADLARRKLEIDPDASSSKGQQEESRSAPPDPRSRWARVRQRARQRMDSEESNATMTLGGDKPSRSNTLLLSTMERDGEEQEEQGEDKERVDEVGSPVEMIDSPKSESSSPERGVQGARRGAGRSRQSEDGGSTRSRSGSGSRPPRPIAGTFLAKSPRAIHETASLPVPGTGSDESAGMRAGSSSSTLAEGSKTPYWEQLATSPKAGILSGESEDESISTRPATMNRDKSVGRGPWPSRQRSSNSPSPRPDLLSVSGSQSSVSSAARSAPNSPRIRPSKGQQQPTSSPASKPKPNNRANSNPPELDVDERELGSQLRSRLSGHPGHARRNSSTHRVLETLDAKHHANDKGQRMVNQYALGPLIGRGAYGNVEKGIDVGTGQEYAIKEFSKSRLKRQQQLSTASRIRKPKFEEDPANRGNDKALSKAKSKSKGKGMDDDEDPLGLIRREIAVMKKLDHPNLVLLYEAINVNTSDSLYLVLEYVPGGTLMDIKIGGEPSAALEVEKARSYFRQLTLGLEYLHSAGVTHRDIKPDNVLLSADRTQVKLCDFGVSEMFTSGDDRTKKSGGSPAFMSPEAAILTQGDVHAKPVDIWAMGVTLYCMLRGSLPFEADNPLELFEAIKEQEPHIPSEWDDDVKDLVGRMLRKDPDERMVMAELREHPWVIKSGQDPLPTTDQNLNEIGKQVEEPSEEEVGNAISTFRASFTVILAIQKMRRMYRRRRGLSSSGSSNSAWSTPNVLSPATEHAPRAHNAGTGRGKEKPDLGPLGTSGLASISPNGVTDGHVTSPEEIEEEKRETDYFGDQAGRGG